MTRPFIEKANKPNDEKLGMILATAKSFYDDLKSEIAKYKRT